MAILNDEKYMGLVDIFFLEIRFGNTIGILYPNNCGSIRRLHHSALLLILLLYLPCPHISFTLNSKLFSLDNPFLLSLVCKTSFCRFSGPLT